jgi:methyl-accepting chemotaxis protein
MKKKKPVVKKKGRFGIRGQIVACFIVPIVFVVFVGLFSYREAENGMEEKYTESTVQTLNTIVEYIDYGCELIESEAFKYAYDKQLSQYYLGLLESDASKRAEAFNNAKDSIRTSAVVNSMINGIYIVTGSRMDMITSGNESQRKGFLEDWSEAETVKSGWNDGHPYADEQIGISSADYILNYNCLSDGGKACVTIDIKQGEIREILEKLNLGEEAIAAFVTKSGKEVFTDEESDFRFFEQDFYQEALESEETAGSSFVNAAGEKYLFLYSKSEKTSSTVCALVPEKTVVSQAYAIRNLTLILVIAASVLAMLLGFGITGRIQKNMKHVVKEVEEVAKGNLTVAVKVKGRDELAMLAESMNGMVRGTKKLVGKVKNASLRLESSTQQVSGTSGEIGHYSRSITQALEEIREGMEAQAESASDCLEKSNSLSEDIRMVSDKVGLVEQQIDKTETMIEQGMTVMDELSKKSETADQKTREVENSIYVLKEQIGKIENFVNMINEISGQTNLLSLNASIEAARAGEAGRGFSVVAEEIRKLAEESAAAANEIGRSVEMIHGQMEVSVTSTQQAGGIVREQTDCVREMLNVFVQMKSDMEQMFEAMGAIVGKVENADANRAETLTSIAAISSVIEQTTAAVTTVADIAEKLMLHVERLDNLAVDLDENMCELTGEVRNFKVD